MSRMDRYADIEENLENEEETPVLSRVNKNQIIYDDAYLNSKVIDINSVIDGEDIVPKKAKYEINYDIPEYEEKSYDINEYISKARENKKEDNLKREINDQEFKEQEDEIRKLIASIDEKSETEDFFSDLKGDNEDTMIGAKYKTDEFDDSIYETLKEENLIDGNTILDHVLGDNTVLSLEKDADEKIDHTFEKILKDDKILEGKKKKLPLIFFCISIVILIIVVVVIIIVR